MIAAMHCRLRDDQLGEIAAGERQIVKPAAHQRRGHHGRGRLKGVPRSTSVYGLPQSALNVTLDGINPIRRRT